MLNFLQKTERINKKNNLKTKAEAEDLLRTLWLFYEFGCSETMAL